MVRSSPILPILSRSFPLVLALALAGCGGGGEESLEPGMGVADVGLLAPRAVIHDAVADVYLVSNVNGPSTAEDRNGFIARITPDGTVENLTWIAPTGPASAIHAPSGMGIRGDSLFVADIGCIAIFDRVSGEGVERRCLEDSSLLSGLAFGPEGSLFVTDSGYEAGAGGLVPSGTAAVYRLVVEDQRRGGTLARGEELGHPMSVAVGSRGIFVVTADPGQVIRLTPEGVRTDLISVPSGSFQGVVFTADGGFAYSSAGDSTVYHVDGTGAVHEVLSGVDAPGDLGYDATRNRLLVPLMNENRILFLDL